MKFNDAEKAEVEKVKSNLKDMIHTKTSAWPHILRELIERDGQISGGVSASLFHSERPKDIDIFLKTQKSIDLFKKMTNDPFILDLVEDVNPNYGMAVQVEGKLITKNAVTFKSNIQIITCETADYRKTFDYVHCMPYYDIQSDAYYISHEQYLSIKNKVLIENRPAEEFRKSKFRGRGWR